MLCLHLWNNIIGDVHDDDDDDASLVKYYKDYYLCICPLPSLPVSKKKLLADPE